MSSFVSFSRRQNRDDSVDSICTKCYQTIASSPMNDLAVAEESHVCNPNWALEGPTAPNAGAVSRVGRAAGLR
jgi:phage tail protein X